MTQTSYLRNGFINYLLEKRAAGIVNVTVSNVGVLNFYKLNKLLQILMLMLCFCFCLGFICGAHISTMWLYQWNFAHEESGHVEAPRRLHTFIHCYSHCINDKRAHVYTTQATDRPTTVIFFSIPFLFIFIRTPVSSLRLCLRLWQIWKSEEMCFFVYFYFILKFDWSTKIATTTTKTGLLLLSLTITAEIEIWIVFFLNLIWNHTILFRSS